MTYTAYDGLISSSGWLTFWLVLFSILTVAALTWFFLYIEHSQNKNKKTTTLIIVINALIIAFELQLIFLRINVVY